jgi:hypothetical protein
MVALGLYQKARRWYLEGKWSSCIYENLDGCLSECYGHLLYLGFKWSHDLVPLLEVVLDLLHSVLTTVELFTH